ncbi:HD domain-containing protein [Metabacillus arenae]|uniref:HD domain-containing protein n=1 Tax=Metabacillus arenae TaxID=2771434 RepID=A0A926NJB8_9BACI|nr:HD domain-containing protein [Metabacillus arenae]MBD1381613.1 HD domain-containing protein [Metabacillus arenae]
MENKVISNVEKFVKEKLEQERSGHDWWHIARVRKLAIEIGEKEQCNLFLVELSALLHDVIDEKIEEKTRIELSQLKSFLNNLDVDVRTIQEVVSIITSISFSTRSSLPLSTEGQVVQDADRLDAIGAIGIARTFTYAGSRGHLIYDPNIKIREEMTYNEYRNGPSTAINHFYEKLLKLKKWMNTETAKKMAEQRDEYMKRFLQQFHNEWNI